VSRRAMNRTLAAARIVVTCAARAHKRACLRCKSCGFHHRRLSSVRRRDVRPAQSPDGASSPPWPRLSQPTPRRRATVKTIFAGPVAGIPTRHRSRLGQHEAHSAGSGVEHVPAVHRLGGRWRSLDARAGLVSRAMWQGMNQQRKISTANGESLALGRELRGSWVGGRLRKGEGARLWL